MKNGRRWKGLIVTIVVLMSLLIALNQLYIPKVLNTDYTEAEYSLENVLKDLKYISTDKHPVGAPWHENVKNYIIDEIKKMNLDYEIQKATVNEQTGRLLSADIDFYSFHERLSCISSGKQSV